MEYLERITSELETFIASAPTNPDVQRGVGMFALYVLGFYAAALSWRAVRAPVMGAWVVSKFLACGLWDGATVAAWLGKRGLGAMAWPFKSGPESPLTAVCRKAMESNRVRYRPSTLAECELLYVGEIGGMDEQGLPDFAARLKNDAKGKEQTSFWVRGQAVNHLLSAKDHKRLSRMARQVASNMRAGEHDADRDLLTEHLARVLTPASEPINTRWGKVPAGGLNESNGRNRTVTVGSSDFV